MQWDRREQRFRQPPLAKAIRKRCVEIRAVKQNRRSKSLKYLHAETAAEELVQNRYCEAAEDGPSDAITSFFLFNVKSRFNALSK